MATPADRPRRSNSTGAVIVLVLTLVLAGAALTAVLQARYDTGESYPNYSSLRSDPLGTRALYESLAQVPGVQTERNFRPLNKLSGKPGEALLLCGLDTRDFALREMLDSEAVARFAAEGGRLIIAVNPTAETSHINRAARRAVDELDEEDREERARKKAKEGPKDAKDHAKKNGPEKEPEPEKKTSSKEDEGDKDTKVEPGHHSQREKPSMAAILKVSAKSREFFYTGKEGAPLEAAPNAPIATADLPPWYSNVYLDGDPTQDWEDGWLSPTNSSNDKKQSKKAKPVDKDSAGPSPWHVIAQKGDRPMIMERSMGAGSVVVCTDRYFLSNEALWKGAKSSFISWLMGGSSHIIFEETHLGAGIGDEDGIMTLARRYRMHGLFLGGLLLFALFVWRSACSLVPPDPAHDLGYWRATSVAGQGTASGLECLLRRGSRPSALLAKCLDVWEGTKTAAAAVPPAHRSRAREILASSKGTRNAPQAYRDIRDALHPSGPRSSSSKPTTPPSHS